MNSSPEYKQRTTQPSIETDDDESDSQMSDNSRCSVLCACMNRMVFYISFGVLILVAIATGVVIWTGASKPSEFWVQEDPPGRNETLLWPAAYSGNGLELVVENALVDSWTPYLEQWVERWDAGYGGTVDPLTLSIQRVAVDTECIPSQGRIKVCNGNYGKTDWRGINIALTNGEYMVNSVVKLNDHWLYDEDQKQYTMCHELGHGFGLAHTDEIYTNINTGECMDYTNRPARNLDPGAFNFDLLQSIYGSAGNGGTNIDTFDNNNINNTATSSPTLEWTGEQTYTGEHGDESEQENRLLRRRTAQVIPDISDTIMEQYYQAVRQMEGMTCIHCLVDLSDGYQVEIHRLLAV